MGIRLFFAAFCLVLFAEPAVAQDDRLAIPVEIIATPSPTVDLNDVARQDQDLQAQQEMAQWSKWMFFGTLASVGISVFALVALFRSLAQTAQSLKTTRLLGEMQTQAYVQATNCKFGYQNSIIIECSNFGQSPAPHFSLNACAQRVRLGEVEKSIKSLPTGFKTWSAMGPGQTLTVNVDVDDRNVVDKFVSGTFAENEVLLISGSIVYNTIFNRDHRTDFAYFAHRPTKDPFRRPTGNLKAFWRVPVADTKGWHEKFPTPWAL